MNEPTLEEELYDMPQEDIDGLKERLANLARNMRARGIESYRFRGYEVGEDLTHGTLTVELVPTATRREFGKPVKDVVVSRTMLLMVDREGNLMVPKSKRHLLKELSQGLILEELAAI